MRDRAKALAGHLIFSLVALGAPLLAATAYFYPGPLFGGDGGREVIQLALAVDLILGPCLTFCVYKKGKKGLLFDLSLIFALQLGAFGYGFHTMLEQRPVAYVYGGQFFHSVTRGQIEGALPSGMEVGGSPLPYFYVIPPQDLKERERQAREVMETGRPYHVQARLWKGAGQTPLSERRLVGLALSEVDKIKTDSGRQIAQQMIAALPEDRRGSYRLALMQMRYGNAVALYNVESGRIEQARRADVGSLAIY